ncbi:MAG: DNA polymerase III subunit alpha [Ignavibacteria bacterium]|jgi:DNA polymerase-3 subunit alpha|nr:DNA polymerase III subunit alpha [Ignavibacteria bacterium]
MAEFIHLHNHTHYSLQDGACTVYDLVKAAKKNNMPAVALTDHGVMFGISEFHRVAKKEGIKPISGMEAYVVAEGSRYDKGKGDDSNGKKRTRNYHHLVLLAKNKTGYKNLSKLSTYGYTQGFYYRPRIDLELLREYGEGLIALSACAGGIVSVHLVNNDYEKARRTAVTYKEIFGDDFYLEIQDHKMEVEKNILAGMPKLSKELGIKLVATNDCHYIEKDHAIAHNILLLLGDKSGTADYHHLRYETDQIYFKSADEMANLFKGYEGAVENTLEIADKVDFALEFEGHLYPKFPIPPESGAETLDEYFEQIAREGLYKRFKNVTPELEDRFNYEIDTIKSMGFSGYFLIVQDYINAAKSRGIPVGPGRGSAAGSLVAYAVGITNVDPFEFDLLFERFLNPARKSMPDIDVDFADSKRERVIEYVKEKYGESSVCQIVTFNRLSSKAVLRDVARVLQIPISVVSSITKFIPSKFGKVYSIEQALAEVPELKWVNESRDPKILELIKYAKILEGMNRNSSKHAAGVVISPGDVSNFVPLATPGNSSDLVTQYNMKELDTTGLLKMDFLGLRTLTIIQDAIDLIKKTHNVEINPDDIPLDDEKTFALFAKGQTTSVFQFESGPMREYLKKLKPTTVKDLSAMNALYRPGPMEFIDDFIKRKHGLAETVYLHPVLEPMLKETYGIIVYQEQVMQIANRAAGMTLAEADLLRRAMGKKDLQAMKEQKVKFVAGAVKNNIAEKTASEIFDAIDKFANYGFNKSHAVAYSVVAYQTAYLKAHYPAEFLAANLTNEVGNTDKVTTFLEDCRKLKIEVLCPDVNMPSVYFDVIDGKILFGMCAIKNVGIGAVEEIKRKREELGRNFKSIFDLCANVDTRTVNKRALEGLILAGALDKLSGTRAQNIAAVEMALEFGSKVKNSKFNITDSLFGGGNMEEVAIPEPPLPEVENWTSKEELSKEREVLGFYLTDHPLRKYELEYRSFATVFLGETETLENVEQVRAIGVVTGLKTKIDRSGKTMAFFTLDDLSGSCECVVFGSTFEKIGKYISEEATVLLVGRPESSGDAIKLQIENAMPLEVTKAQFTKSLKVVIDQEKFSTPEIIIKLKKVLEKSQGNIPVILHVVNNGEKPRLFHLKNYRVKICDELAHSLLELLGEDSILYCT